MRPGAGRRSLSKRSAYVDRLELSLVVKLDRHRPIRAVGGKHLVLKLRVDDAARALRIIEADLHKETLRPTGLSVALPLLDEKSLDLREMNRSHDDLGQRDEVAGRNPVRDLTGPDGANRDDPHRIPRRRDPKRYPMDILDHIDVAGPGVQVTARRRSIRQSLKIARAQSTRQPTKARIPKLAEDTRRNVKRTLRATPNDKSCVFCGSAKPTRGAADARDGPGGHGRSRGCVQGRLGTGATEAFGLQGRDRIKTLLSVDEEVEGGVEGAVCSVELAEEAAVAAPARHERMGRTDRCSDCRRGGRA